MEGRMMKDASYRFGFNGKEKDGEGEWGNSAHYDYGFRIYDPSIARFLSVDPLTSSYPMLTPYQFASNTPISGIDLDGLEFKLKIFSSTQSQRFYNAYEVNDLYIMRAVTLWSRTHTFKSDYGLQCLGLDECSTAAQLYESPNYPPGLTVELHKFNDNGQIEYWQDLYFPPSTDDLPEDALYPTDVKFGTEFYGNAEYVPHEVINATGGLFYGTGKELGSGYLSGLGYFQYSSDLEIGMLGVGVGADATLFGRGYFTGEGLPTFENFGGKGQSVGIDIDYGGSIGLSYWQSGDNWKGFNISGGGGLAIGVFKATNSETSILFPTTKTTYSIIEAAWNERQKNSDEIIPIIKK